MWIMFKGTRYAATPVYVSVPMEEVPQCNNGNTGFYVNKNAKR
jgi:hypothetical protein